MMEPRVYTVTQINRYVRSLFERDFILNSIWIKGEISNFKERAGHFYFTLKDASSALNCVMFKGSAMLLPFLPENGMSVVICGYLSVYEKTGQYQLYAELLEPMGIGALNVAFEQLKEKLSAEGLFDSDYKREICKNPETIALITSPGGAAVRDMIQVSKRRSPGIKIVVVPTLVQGDRAPEEIVRALRTVNEWGRADTILLGRGGGSVEDLWAFNDERVARAIFASNIPVISAVGHETDFTIADFVADMRAPTPSAAAELAVADTAEAMDKAAAVQNRMNAAMKSILFYDAKRVDTLLERPVFRRPMEKIANHQIYVDTLRKNMQKEIKFFLDKRKNKFENTVEKLSVLSPLAVLKRGYGVVQKADAVVTSAGDVRQGDSISIEMKDGRILASVSGVLGTDGEEKNDV